MHYVARFATRLKVLWFEGHGLCVLYKRLHRAVFDIPLGTAGELALRIDGVALAKLLAGVTRERRGASIKSGGAASKMNEMANAS